MATWKPRFLQSERDARARSSASSGTQGLVGDDKFFGGCRTGEQCENPGRGHDIANDHQTSPLLSIPHFRVHRGAIPAKVTKRCNRLAMVSLSEPIRSSPACRRTQTGGNATKTLKLIVASATALNFVSSPARARAGRTACESPLCRNSGPNSASQQDDAMCQQPTFDISSSFASRNHFAHAVVNCPIVLA